MRYIIVLIIILYCSGCAVFNRHNTPTLNRFEKYFVSEDRTLRLLAYPVTIPFGLLSVSIDALIVHPISVFNDAIDDTRTCLWNNTRWDEEYVTECALLLPRTISTPVIFTGDFIGRASFNIPGRNYEQSSKREIVEQKNLEEKLKNAKSLFDKAQADFLAKQYDAALQNIDMALEENPGYHDALILKAKIYIIQKLYIKLLSFLLQNRFCTESEDLNRFMVGQILSSHPQDQLQFLHLLEQLFERISKSKANPKNVMMHIQALREILASGESQLKQQAIRVAKKINTKEAKIFLKSVADGSDPFLAISAQWLLDN